MAVPAEWWVLCGYTDAAGSLIGYKGIDLGLDCEITGDEVAPRDEAEFQ